MRLNRPRWPRFWPMVVACGWIASCGTRLPERAFDTTTTTTTTDTAAATTASAVTTNPASDVGVTAGEITLGLVVSRTSPLGVETFSAPQYGAQAYVAALDARGGINGRQVKIIVCDDSATGSGNRECVRKLIDDDHVFAFVGSSIFNYAGASFVDSRGVPDIGGQPIGNAYDQYSHLFSIYGSSSPRNGIVGFGGKLYGGTEVYRLFKEMLGTKVAGVVAYNQSDSLRFANLTAAGLELEGYTVVREQLDFSVPNWSAAAIDMRSRHVDAVFDALDSAGNVKLCRAMDDAGLAVKAKAVTVQSWSETVRADYRDAPRCRNSLYATATSRSYMDTANPAIAQFRAEVLAAFPERETKLSMWELEGWAGAQWFADAAQSCGAALTRTCVESFLNRPVDYDGHGALSARNFVVSSDPTRPAHNCLVVAQWQDSGYDGKGGWVSRTPGPEPACFDVPNVAYRA